MPSPDPSQERRSIDSMGSGSGSGSSGSESKEAQGLPSAENGVALNGHAHKPSLASTSAAASARPSLDDLPPAPPSVSTPSSSPVRHEKATNDVHAHARPAGDVDAEESAERVHELEEELRREREEKEQLAAQYRNLLDKLTHMRTTLGNKLKQDAEELDRREQAINTLTERSENHAAEISTLTVELQDLSDRHATLLSEAALLRSRTSQIDQLESELQGLRSEREKDRLVREEENREWERERVGWEREKEAWEETERAWERERREGETWREKWEDERQRASRLEGVLEDFMTAKESEMKTATSELSAQLSAASASLVEYKARTKKAEAALSQSASSSTRCAELEREVKEKNLLIGKLRHEAVIINEHLTEALRRLRKSSSENNVDRRLITNTLLAFLSTPRADSKRFEMLSLLASVLGWNDDERSKAGLQRSMPGSAGKKPPSSSRSSASERGTPTAGDETESFSKMWVEFLMKESSQPLSPPTSTSSLPMLSPLSHSPSPTPTASTFSGLLSPTGSVFTPLPSVNEGTAGNLFFIPGGAGAAGPGGADAKSPRVGLSGLPRIPSWTHSQNGNAGQGK